MELFHGNICKFRHAEALSHRTDRVSQAAALLLKAPDEHAVRIYWPDFRLSNSEAVLWQDVH